jgi:hypothetical protein
MADEVLTEYDYNDVYKKEIYPLISEVKKRCKLTGIPFIFTCAVKNDVKKTQYVHEGNLTGSNNIHLKDDRFEQFLGALCSFDLVPRTSFNKHYESDASVDVLNDDAMAYIQDGSGDEENSEAVMDLSS